MRWPGTGDFRSDDYKITYSGTSGKREGWSDLREVYGTESVEDYVQFSDRIFLVKTNTEPKKYCYNSNMPTTNDADEEIERMYEDLNYLRKGTRADDNLIIMGNMNATVGEGEEGTTFGKWFLSRKLFAFEIESKSWSHYRKSSKTRARALTHRHILFIYFI